MSVYQACLNIVPDCGRMLHFCALSLGQKSMKASEFPPNIVVISHSEELPTQHIGLLEILLFTLCNSANTGIMQFPQVSLR